MTDYSNPLPTDANSAKLEGVLADNGGNNTFVAKAGANYRTQNGEPVADQVVKLNDDDAAVLSDIEIGTGDIKSNTDDILSALRNTGNLYSELWVHGNTAAAYAAGDMIGDIQLITPPGGDWELVQVMLLDREQVKADIDILLFDATPTCEDHTPFDPSDADLYHLCGLIHIVAADYVDFVDNSAVVKNCAGNGYLIDTLGGMTPGGFAIMRCVSTPTFSTTNALQLRLFFKRHGAWA